MYVNPNVAPNHWGESVAQMVSPFADKPLARDRGTLEISTDGLAASIDALQNVIEQLAEQLGPVMLPAMPSNATSAGTATPAPMTSSIVGYIQKLRERVDGLGYRVQEVSKRLEV